MQNYKRIIRYFVLAISLILIASSFWISDIFGQPSFEQVLYHIYYGIPKNIRNDSAFLPSFIIKCLALPILVTLLIYYRDLFKKQIKYISQKPYLWIILALLVLVCKIGLPNHIKKMIRREDYFSAHYIPPQSIKISNTEKTKNLIMIYAESLEDSFADREVFGTNLLAPLDTSIIGGQSFKHYLEAPGTNWTSAAIVATQCGIPLRAIMSDLQRDFILPDSAHGFQLKKTFLPNAECLGDILAKHGYQNIYISGSDLDFGALGRFFGNHGYNQLYGQSEILDSGYKPEQMNSFIGSIHDRDLLEFTKSIIEEQTKKDTPYNITITTLDTHAPFGHTSKECMTNEISNLPTVSRPVLCTSTAISDFIKDLEQKGYLENTIIIIIGDHLFMANNEQKRRLFYKERSIFNRFISKQKFKINRDEILPFDIFPTTLYSLGFDIENGKIGLGYSGFGELKEMPNNNRYEEIQDKLLNYSKGYLELWKN